MVKSRFFAGCQSPPSWRELDRKWSGCSDLAIFSAHDFGIHWSIGLRRPNALNKLKTWILGDLGIITSLYIYIYIYIRYILLGISLILLIHFGMIWRCQPCGQQILQATLMHVADTLALCRGVKEVTIYSDENCERYHTLGMLYLKDRWHNMGMGQ